MHEARAAGEVRHKHLVPITDAGEADGRRHSHEEGAGQRGRDRGEKDVGVHRDVLEPRHVGGAA